MGKIVNDFSEPGRLAAARREFFAACLAAYLLLARWT